MGMARLMLPIAAALLLAGFAAPPAPMSAQTHATPAKLGFDYLTAEQMKDLWRRADDYALAEAFLKQCDKPSYVEQRMRQAAGPCIRPEALNKVASYFRNKVAQFSRTHAFRCDSEKAKSLAKSTQAKISRDVEEVRSMCRACFIC
jgi:hypothetical protein